MTLFGMDGTEVTVRARFDEAYRSAMRAIREFRDVYMMLEEDEREELAQLSGRAPAIFKVSNEIFGDQGSLF